MTTTSTRVFETKNGAKPRLVQGIEGIRTPVGVRAAETHGITDQSSFAMNNQQQVVSRLKIIGGERCRAEKET